MKPTLRKALLFLIDAVTLSLAYFVSYYIAELAALSPDGVFIRSWYLFVAVKLITYLLFFMYSSNRRRPFWLDIVGIAVAEVVCFLLSVFVFNMDIVSNIVPEIILLVWDMLVGLLLRYLMREERISYNYDDYSAYDDTSADDYFEESMKNDVLTENFSETDEKDDMEKSKKSAFKDKIFKNRKAVEEEPLIDDEFDEDFGDEEESTDDIDSVLEDSDFSYIDDDEILDGLEMQDDEPDKYEAEDFPDDMLDGVAEDITEDLEDLDDIDSDVLDGYDESETEINDGYDLPDGDIDDSFNDVSSGHDDEDDLISTDDLDMPFIDADANDDLSPLDESDDFGVFDETEFDSINDVDEPLMDIETSNDDRRHSRIVG